MVAKTYLLMSNTRELARRLEGTGVDVIGGECLVLCVWRVGRAGQSSRRWGWLVGWLIGTLLLACQASWHSQSHAQVLLT